VICTLAVILVGYQALVTGSERARFPPPGRLINVVGYRLHLRCAGISSPTVILESGTGMSSNAWERVQPEVMKFTRVSASQPKGASESWNWLW
jgi:hypothetical protein